MKILLAVVFCMISIRTLGQSTDCATSFDPQTKTKFSYSAEIRPEPEGGMENIGRLVMKNIRIDSTANRLQSKVIIAFIVNYDGRITGQRVIRNIDGSTIAEQLLAEISKLNWKPGYCNNKPVPVFFTLPFNLRLE